MSTRSEQIFNHIGMISPRAECDDCLAKTLELPRRQVAYNYCTKLAVEGKVDRFKRHCHRCGAEKVSTSSEQSLAHRVIESVPKASINATAVLHGLASLKSIGFTKVGLWVMDGEKLSLQLLKRADMKPALYAFVTKSDVLYVGKTSRQLSRRLYHYSRPGPTQSANIRLNDLLVDALGENTLLEIFAFGDADETRLGPFIFDIPAALELDIIQKLQPKWNKRK